MASLADVIVGDSFDGNGNSESARKALTEAVTDSGASVDNLSNTQHEDDGLPAKFKGKSAKEIADAYQNLESRLGSMANELGTQRALTDRFLELKRNDDLSRNGSTKAIREAPKPVTTADLLDRPQETLERAISDGVKSVADELREENRQLRALSAKQSFESKHKDYQSTVQSSEFMDWLKASPLRLRAAQVANNGDWQVADELFTEYNVQTSSRQTTQQTERQTSNVDAARAASFTSSGNASGNDGKSKKGGTVYKRSDLMALRIKDPDAYYDEAFQEKILLAHHEGRVV